MMMLFFSVNCIDDMLKLKALDVLKFNCILTFINLIATSM